MKIGKGAPRRFEVAKSMRLAAARAVEVTTDVGSRLATPDSPVTPPVRCASFFAASAAATAVTRSEGAIAPAGSFTGTGVNALPPAL